MNINVNDILVIKKNLNRILNQNKINLNSFKKYVLNNV